jgi:hypothetical protein
LPGRQKIAVRFIEHSLKEVFDKEEKLLMVRSTMFFEKSGMYTPFLTDIVSDADNDL